MDGFIKLHRKIQDNWIWQDKPFSKGQAWIDLLMLANHKDGKFLSGNDLINVNQGDVITSEVKLSKRWGWSRHKIRNFLQVLERDSMIVQKKDTKRTAITICNYKHYSDYADSKRTTKGQQKDSAGTALGQQRDTIKNDKKYKNEKKYIYNPPPPLAKAIEEFKEFRASIKKPMSAKAVELLHKELTKLAGNDEQLKIKIIEQSILRGWQGVFPLKDDMQGKNGNIFLDMLREEENG